MGSGPKLFGLARVHCTLYIPCVLRVYPVLYFRRLSLTYQWCLAGFPAQDSYNLQLIMIFIEATPLGVVLLVSLRMLLIGPFLSSRRMATDSEMEGSEAILASVKALTDKFDTLQKEVEELKRRSPSKSGSSSSDESENESDRDHRRRSYRSRSRSRRPRSRRPRSRPPRSKSPRSRHSTGGQPRSPRSRHSTREHSTREQAWSRDSQAEHEQGGGGGDRAENKDFRLIGHLCASRFPSMVYCSFMPGQITNLTGQKAILFGICPMAACYFQLWGGGGGGGADAPGPQAEPGTGVHSPQQAGQTGWRLRSRRSWTSARR